jgi:hypothetical protein
MTKIRPKLTFHGHMHVSGEAHTTVNQSIYSMSVVGTPGNVGVLDVTDQRFSWLPPDLGRRVLEQVQTAQSDLAEQNDGPGLESAGSAMSDCYDRLRDQVSDDNSGRRVVRTSGSAYEIDLDHRTVLRHPSATAEPSINDVVRPLTTIRGCVVGEQGRYQMRPDVEAPETHWQISSIVRSTEPLS